MRMRWAIYLRQEGHPAPPPRNPRSIIDIESAVEDPIPVGVHYDVDIEEVYYGATNGPILGWGVTGPVRIASRRITGERFAVKRLDLLDAKTENDQKQLLEEIYAMCRLEHPHVVRLEEVYESESEIYLVEELCEGGELFDALQEQSQGRYEESRCRDMVRQILDAVCYIHSKGIIHRDLKLENFLLTAGNENKHSDCGDRIKMIDFGLSKHFITGEQHEERVGTPYTVAPEVIKGQYNERCDLWAVGVITYLLLSGESPFGGNHGTDESLAEVRDSILRGRLQFDTLPSVWGDVSPEARNFLRELLQIDPDLRPTAEEALTHPWLSGGRGKTRFKEEQSTNEEGRPKCTGEIVRRARLRKHFSV